MAVSPDDRFASLIDSSAERGGWVPGDVFTADTEGEEEPVAARRIRLPVLVALALATVAVLLLALYVFRPAEQHDPTAGQFDTAGSSAASDPTGDNETGANQKAGPEDAGNGQVVVHVTGAVHAPSVVTLGAGARVQDAVEAAGGLQGDADSESINLARVLQDGEQIHIPAEGEKPPAGSADAQGSGGDSAGTSGGSTAAGDPPGGTADAGGTGTASGTGSGAGSGTAGGKIDLNTADAAALQTLPGVGPVTAEAIIAHRETQPFGSVDDLLLVKGIGPKTFESLRDLVSVG
ncbi:helix-hairpin-helix domain-containing protein [Brevibacterium sp. GP-SGM9]|uniref:helix-hairpin-helix domain-containing protein n=1 Tax=Brevibacterium sp. GP-SGM9 TaxID=3376990 RepID=UPI0039A74F22